MNQTIFIFGSHNQQLTGLELWSRFDEHTTYGNMVLNQDFREFIEQLNEKKVSYLVVGGYAVAFHGNPRYTKDIDFWIWLNESNVVSTKLAKNRN
ncbi:MAG: hypothetical protein AAGI38_21970 [Bacteroidota bacterium]